MNVNVDDILFKTSRLQGLTKVKVTKITPSGNIRVSDGALLTPDLRKKTSDTWDSDVYSIWSQKLEDKFKIQILQIQLNEKLKKLNVFDLNDEEFLINLLNVLNKI